MADQPTLDKNTDEPVVKDAARDAGSVRKTDEAVMREKLPEGVSHNTEADNLSRDQ